MQRCPFCAEDIQDRAIVCKHCHRALTGARAGATVLKYVVYVVLALIALRVVGALINPDRQPAEARASSSSAAPSNRAAGSANK
jgi:hypothetical protein